MNSPCKEQVANACLGKVEHTRRPVPLDYLEVQGVEDRADELPLLARDERPQDVPCLHYVEPFCSCHHRIRRQTVLKQGLDRCPPLIAPVVGNQADETALS